MSEFTCPACRADIESDLLEQTGKAECPFCGADLSQIGLAPPAPIRQDIADDFKVPESDLQPAGAAAGATGNLPSLPAGSKLRIIEVGNDRLVLYIPAGGKQAAGIGFFALIWNGFLCVFTPLFLGGMVKQGRLAGLELLGLVAFLSLFWAVGLGMFFSGSK